MSGSVWHRPRVEKPIQGIKGGYCMNWAVVSILEAFAVVLVMDLIWVCIYKLTAGKKEGMTK
jgi:hypothetical protein